MEQEVPKEFTELTEREMLIAEMFAVQLLQGIATFPHPVGPEEGKLFTATEKHWIGYGIESAWELGRDLILPMFAERMRERKGIKWDDDEASAVQAESKGQE